MCWDDGWTNLSFCVQWDESGYISYFAGYVGLMFHICFGHVLYPSVSLMILPIHQERCCSDGTQELPGCNALAVPSILPGICFHLRKNQNSPAAQQPFMERLGHVTHVLRLDFATFWTLHQWPTLPRWLSLWYPYLRIEMFDVCHFEYHQISASILSTNIYKYLQTIIYIYTYTYIYIHNIYIYVYIYTVYLQQHQQHQDIN
jgi:hypothetical protein